MPSLSFSYSPTQRNDNTSRWDNGSILPTCRFHLPPQPLLLSTLCPQSPYIQMGTAAYFLDPFFLVTTYPWEWSCSSPQQSFYSAAHSPWLCHLDTMDFNLQLMVSTLVQHCSIPPSLVKLDTYLSPLMTHHYPIFGGLGLGAIPKQDGRWWIIYHLCPALSTSWLKHQLFYWFW